MKVYIVFGILSLVVLLNCTAAPLDSKALEEEDPELIGGFFEGDMDIELTRNGVRATTRRWANAKVYYKMGSALDADHKLKIKTAMERIEEISCIRFYAATSTMTAFIKFTSQNTGCHSRVGYVGNAQQLNLQNAPLDTGCFRLGTILHEILHALGFYHQQCASDRDNYVSVITENIIEGKESNFKKYGADTVTDFGIEYDYGSILHYGAYAFSKNGEKTIVPKNGDDIVIGQRLGLSTSDIAKLNLMYKCPAKI